PPRWCVRQHPTPVLPTRVPRSSIRWPTRNVIAVAIRYSTSLPDREPTGWRQAPPLHTAGETIGTLEVVNPMRRGAFSDADRPQLEAFAQLFAVAVVQHGAHADLGLPPAGRP